MTDTPKTVTEAWDMRCPACGKDDTLVISATVSVRLHPDGTDDSNSDGHEWNDDSPCMCGAVDGCGFRGKVKDFEVPVPKYPHWNPEGDEEHEAHKLRYWRNVVAHSGTRLGYVEWVNHQLPDEPE